MSKFKTGQSGNPNGRPPMPPDIKGARQLNKIELERIINEYISMSLDELKARASDPNAQVLEVMIAKIMAESIKKGDERKLQFFLDRLVGPLPRPVELSNKEDEGFVMIIKDYADKKSKSE